MRLDPILVGGIQSAIGRLLADGISQRPNRSQSVIGGQSASENRRRRAG